MLSEHKISSSVSLGQRQMLSTSLFYNDNCNSEGCDYLFADVIKGGNNGVFGDVKSVFLALIPCCV